MLTTCDYEKFGHIIGNRPIKKKHVDELITSIEENGWLHQPITVNSKYQIIDGQHRFEALRALRMPVEYVVVDDADGNTCQVLNANQKNWTISDYISYYAKNGKGDYVWLYNLDKRYRNVGLAVIHAIVCDSLQVSGGDYTIIKSGQLNIQDKHKRENIIFFLSEIQDVSEQLKGRTDAFKCAVAYAYKYDICDADRLRRVLRNNKYNLINCSSFEEWLKQIEDLYNKGLRSEKKLRLITKYRGEK